MKLIDKVRQNPSLLGSYSTPPFAVQRAAVESDPKSIRYIHNPRPEIQAQAVLNGGITAYKLIENPSLEAKKALIKVNPEYVTSVACGDESLYEYAIRCDPLIITDLKKQPYRLQALALSLVRSPSTVIFDIPDLHENLVMQHLSTRPGDYSKFKNLPLLIELDLINQAKTVSNLESIFTMMRNPSTACQNRYVRVMVVLSTRQQANISNSKWWSGLSNRIDDSLKYELLRLVNYDNLSNFYRTRLKEIMEGTPELLTALTILD